MGRQKRWGLGLGLLLAGFLGLSLWAWRARQGPEVLVQAPVRSVLSERVVASGRVLAPAQVSVGSVVLAQAKTVHVDEGDTVSAGQLLIELDHAEAQAALDQAKAARAQASARLEQVQRITRPLAQQGLRETQARLQQIQSQYARQKALFDSGASTQEQVDEAAKTLQVAQSQNDSALLQLQGAGPGGSDERAAAAALAQAQASQALAQARLEQTRLVAPCEAIVLQRSVEPGDVVQPGRTLLLLARTGPTRLVVQVDEKNLARLRPGLPSQASAEAFAGQRFEATVSSIAPRVDALRGTVEVKLQVPRPPAYLRPDMTVSVDIQADPRDQVLTVPLRAVKEPSSERPWVWTVKEGLLVRQVVRLGAQAGERVEVVGGVDEKASVVVSSPASVKEGARVRPRPDREVQGAL